MKGGSPATSGSAGERPVVVRRVVTPRQVLAVASLVITPESDGVGMLEWHQLDRMREAGRRAAVEALERAPAARPPVAG